MQLMQLRAEFGASLPLTLVSFTRGGRALPLRDTNTAAGEEAIEQKERERVQAIRIR